MLKRKKVLTGNIEFVSGQRKLRNQDITSRSVSNNLKCIETSKIKQSLSIISLL